MCVCVHIQDTYKDRYRAIMNEYATMMYMVLGGGYILEREKERGREREREKEREREREMIRKQCS